MRGTDEKEHLCPKRYKNQPTSSPKKIHPQDRRTRTEKREGEMLYSVYTGMTSTTYSGTCLESRK